MYVVKYKIFALTYRACRNSTGLSSVQFLRLVLRCTKVSNSRDTENFGAEKECAQGPRLLSVSLFVLFFN